MWTDIAVVIHIRTFLWPLWAKLDLVAQLKRSWHSLLILGIESPYPKLELVLWVLAIDSSGWIYTLSSERWGYRDVRGSEFGTYLQSLSAEIPHAYVDTLNLGLTWDL